MTKTKRIAAVALVVVLALSATGCRRVLLEDGGTSGSRDNGGATVTDSSDVALEGATSLDADIRMGAGRLTMTGGAEEGSAMMADFDYTPADWEPRVTYSVAGSEGELDVRQPDLGFRLGDNRNNWDLRLPNDVPLKLRVSMGAGQSDLDLSGMRLEKLEVELGAGEATVDLSGEWSNDLDARIEAGVGRLEIRVPATVGVRLTGDRQGIGEFEAEGFRRDGSDLVNDAWNTAEYKLDIDLQQGVGEVVVETVR